MAKAALTKPLPSLLSCDTGTDARARYAIERLAELLVALSGCPVIRTSLGGSAADFRSLGALVSNSPKNPTPSSGKFSRLTAIDLRLPIAGLEPAKEGSKLFELFGHERAPWFDLLIGLR